MTPETSLLVTNADVMATMDEQRRELRGASLRVRGAVIEAIWPAGQMPPGTTADEVIDARGHAVLPGLVNTHHHMFQSLTRAVPAAQNAELFGWLKTLYPIWAGLTPEMVRVSTQLAMAELLLSGCTTSSDHLYLYPNGVRLDDSIEAAAAIGMRFHAARGSMSVGESAGGLPPDALVEPEALILADTRRLIETHHDHGRYAMLRVVAAPCSPFSVSQGLMRDSAALARSLGTRLHTHLAENDHDIAYSRTRFNMTPTEYADSVGWLGDDVWFALASSSMPPASPALPPPAPAWPTAPAATCGWPRASPRCARCWTPACRSAWGWTAAPATMAPTCWARPAWRCCWRGWGARWMPSAVTTARPR